MRRSRLQVRCAGLLGLLALLGLAGSAWAETRSDIASFDIRLQPGFDPRGLYIGPVFVEGGPSHSGLRKVLYALPEGLLKRLGAPIGPWAMTADVPGNGLGLGLGMYGRF